VCTMPLPLNKDPFPLMVGSEMTNKLGRRAHVVRLIVYGGKVLLSLSFHTFSLRTTPHIYNLTYDSMQFTPPNYHIVRSLNYGWKISHGHVTLAHLLFQKCPHFDCVTRPNYLAWVLCNIMLVHENWNTPIFKVRTSKNVQLSS